MCEFRELILPSKPTAYILRTHLAGKFELRQKYIFESSAAKIESTYMDSEALLWQHLDFGNGYDLCWTPPFIDSLQFCSEHLQQVLWNELAEDLHINLKNSLKVKREV